jgi:AraC-like DNA-binding protein
MALQTHAAWALECEEARDRDYDSINVSASLLGVLAPHCDYDGGRLADRLKVSRRHLQRIFAAQLGRSPQDWLKEQRLIRARRMLQNARTVKEVAHSLGFRHVSHFSRDFKQRFGIAPSALLPRR